MGPQQFLGLQISTEKKLKKCLDIFFLISAFQYIFSAQFLCFQSLAETLAALFVLRGDTMRTEYLDVMLESADISVSFTWSYLRVRGSGLIYGSVDMLSY